MARVEGVVVVRRPSLAEAPERIAPANSLDFVSTLKSYFDIFTNSLLPK